MALLSNMRVSHLLKISSQFRRHISRCYSTKPVQFSKSPSLITLALYCVAFNTVGVAAGCIIGGVLVPKVHGRDYVTEKDKSGLVKDPCGRELLALIECTRTLCDTDGCAGLLITLEECRRTNSAKEPGC